MMVLQLWIISTARRERHNLTIVETHSIGRLKKRRGVAILDDIFRLTKMELKNVLKTSVVLDCSQYCTPGVLQQVKIKPKPFNIGSIRVYS